MMIIKRRVGVVIMVEGFFGDEKSVGIFFPCFPDLEQIQQR